MYLYGPYVMRLLKDACQMAAIITLALGAHTSQSLVKAYLPKKQKDEGQYREVLYLPKKDALESIHLGYRNVAADILWFFTINYFGKHYRSDQDYRWLEHFCDVITTLDPKALHVYQFGAMMLAWEEEKPDQAIALLTKAYKHFSDNWFIPYLRGMMFLYFKKDLASAKKDLLRAAQLPNVHPTVKLLTAKLSVKLGSDESDIVAIESLIATSSDPKVKRILQRRLKKIREQKGLVKGSIK